VKRIDIDQLKPGDIVLTASRTLTGKGIRAATAGLVSHAMICVGHGSVIDSTPIGVQARNLQRELYHNDEAIFAFRSREPLNPVQLREIVGFAREQIGARYSTIEAIRSVTAGRRPRSRRQFCSRLVARAYAHAGIPLVADEDYCVPEELRLTATLVELADVTETLSAAEVAMWQARPNPVAATQQTQNAILGQLRALDPAVETMNDVPQMAIDHPEWDDTIADLLRSLGYLDLWRHDHDANPCHYDVEILERCVNETNAAVIRRSCQSLIAEYHSGGARYATSLATLAHAQRLVPRRTNGLLIALYEHMVRDDHLIRETARLWLERHHSSDVGQFMERIAPHTDMWFAIVDHVEPKLGAIARLSIEREGSRDVCSSCGDPASDYRIANAPEAMPGVPSLRLCGDCLAIRRNLGEVLVPLD